jgi:hypothetical protein
MTGNATNTPSTANDTPTANDTSGNASERFVRAVAGTVVLIGFVLGWVYNRLFA